jgi:hypothetical protein
MLAHKPIGYAISELFARLVLLPDEHRLVSYSTSCTPQWYWTHALCLRPGYPTPPTSSLCCFLLLWLPKKLKDYHMEDVGGAERRRCRCGVLEVNAIDEWWKVEQETRCHMLLIGLLINLEIVGRWWQQTACMQACVFRRGQCDGIWCPNDPKDHPDVLQAIISCLIVQRVK